MITTREVVGLLDVFHLVGLCNTDRRLLEMVLAECGVTQLLNTGAWPPVRTEPVVLDWINTRGLLIGQDADLWLYQVESIGTSWKAMCSGPRGELEYLPRTPSWQRAQLMCEQHRRQRRASVRLAEQAPTASGG